MAESDLEAVMASLARLEAGQARLDGRLDALETEVRAVRSRVDRLAETMAMLHPDAPQSPDPSD